MAFTPDFTPDYYSFENFYIAYPNGVGGDGKTIWPGGDGNIPGTGDVYIYDESEKTFKIYKTIEDFKRDDQHYIYSSKNDTDAIKIQADNGGGIDIDSEGNVDVNSLSDINITGENQTFKINDGTTPGSLKIIDNNDAELMVVNKNGATIKVPFIAEQGIDNLINEEFITIGAATTSAGNRGVKMVKQTGINHSIVSITESTNTIILSTNTTLVNDDFFQVLGTTYNDGIYQVLSGGGSTTLVVNSSVNSFEQDETPASANVIEIVFESITYNNSNDSFEFTGDLKLPDNRVIGNNTTSNLIQLNTSDITIIQKLLVSDTTSSTTKDTGSFVIEGGAGIEENLNVGGNVGITGNSSISGLLNITGNININGASSDLKIQTGRYLTCEDNSTLIQMNSDNITLNGNIKLPDNAIIRNNTISNILQFGTSAIQNNLNLIFNDEAYIGNSTTSNMLQLSASIFKINTNTVLQNDANIGVIGNSDLLTLESSVLTIDGNIKINDDANVGITSDIDLLKLSSENLYIQGDTPILTLKSIHSGEINSCYLRMGDNSSETVGIIEYSHNSNMFIFDANSIESSRISSDGVEIISGKYIKTYNNTAKLQFNSDNILNQSNFFTDDNYEYGQNSGEKIKYINLQTNNATPTVQNLLTLSSGEIANIEVKVLAKDSTANDLASYHLESLFYDNSGIATQQGSTYSIISEKSDISWDCDFSLTGSDLNINLTVTGDSTNTVNWKIIIKYITD